MHYCAIYSIDKCSTENECHYNSSCKNTKVSYICTCQDGLEGDGKNCMAGKILFKIPATKSSQKKSLQKGNSSSKYLQFVLACTRGVIGATRETRKGREKQKQRLLLVFVVFLPQTHPQQTKKEPQTGS